MQGKLSPKAKRIILIVLAVLLAGFLIYTLIKQQKEEESDPSGETITLELADASDNDPSKPADESEELPFEGTELPPQTDPTETLPPQTDPPDLYGPTLPPQTDPPGFWDDPIETETVLPPQTDPPETQAPAEEAGIYVVKNGTYTDREGVAQYLHKFGKLPSNYVTKNEADSLGNKSGKSIGGDHFGNYEGLLPKGTTYHECDIDATINNRGQKRIVWSANGHIYYTPNHYKGFYEWKGPNNWVFAYGKK